LLVVDFMRGFVDPTFALGSPMDAEITATRSLLSLARARRVPIIFTVEAFSADPYDAGLWPRKIPAARELTLGSRWVELDERLDRRPEEPVLVKKGPSAFCGTNLAALLVSLAIDTVILCGTTTSGCIRATAIDLMQYSFPTLIPSECVGDRALAPHQANLLDIDAQYADVVSLADMLTYLGEHSPTD
jgi:maleamate amidohydrolase